MRKLLLLIGLLGACRYDAALIELTVTGSPPPTTQLVCTIDSSVSGHATLSIPGTAGAPLAFPETFTVALPTAKRAHVTIEVASGAISGSTSVDIDGNGLYKATIVLGGTGDLGGADLSGDLATTPTDAAGADGGVVLPPGYGFARDLTIHHSEVGVASGPMLLFDYPIPVKVSDPSMRSVANGGHVARADASDVTFTAAGAPCNGPATCVLASEIEKYDPVGGALYAWVKVPALTTQSATSDTVVTMLYGNAGVTRAIVDPTDTWSSGFGAVWHLASNNDDSTANLNNASSTMYTAASAGIFGGAESFDGSKAKVVEVPHTASLDVANMEDFTVSLWMRTSQMTGQPDLVSREQYGYGSSYGFVVSLDLMANPHTWGAALHTTGGNVAVTATSDLADGAWHAVVAGRQGTVLFLYQDGVLAGSVDDAMTGGAIFGPPDVLFGGVFDASGISSVGLYAGDTADIRFSTVARSAAWAATDHKLVTEPSAIDIGAEHAP